MRDAAGTLVFYGATGPDGATPAFRYYLRRAGLEPMPALSVLDFWSACASHPGSPACGAGGIYYGAWLGGLPLPAQLDSVRATLGGYPPRLWLVFAHITPGEDGALLNGLRQWYDVAAGRQGANAALYLLQRRDQPPVGQP